ncbi:phage tail protein [Bacillus massiliglaciei]|uniref:phage tail protein n=1 Tax=Bacillus massiliglaciei TaxID=1816693 RepID=UPI000DA5F11C|nr:phage tail protein [Bacillus massiliglaciei]
MYRVTIQSDNQTDEIEIHNAKVNNLKLPEGSIKKEINLIDSFDFRIYPGNPGYGKIRPFRTLIKVLNLKTGKYDFEGRVLKPSKNMENTGVTSTAFTCEGELGYLHDSQQRHLEFRGTPRQLLQTILDYHNSQVEDYKHFHIGEMDVTNSTDNQYIYLSAETTTFDTIKDKLLDRLGGEIRVRKENGIRYLDYMKKFGEVKKTPIRIAKNLLSMSVDVDPTSIISRLTPLGARIESENPDATDASEERLSISSVNGGKPYLDGNALIEEFGIQGGTVVYDDVTDVNNLLRKGQADLEAQKTVLTQYTIEAVDLFLIGLDPDSLDVYNSHPVYNPVMGIDDTLRIVGKSIDINGPEKASITIGDKMKKLYEYQADATRATKNIARIESRVGEQSQRIGTLSVEIKTVNQSVAQINQSIIDSDLPGINQAIIDLNKAIYDLNDAVEGVPLYDNATSEKSGLMPAADKAKMNLISVKSLTDLEQMKMVISELQKKLQLISVLHPQDLDQMNERITNLEGGIA